MSFQKQLLLFLCGLTAVIGFGCLLGFGLHSLEMTVRHATGVKSQNEIATDRHAQIVERLDRIERELKVRE